MERQATGAVRPRPSPLLFLGLVITLALGLATLWTVAAGAPGVAQVTPTCTPVWTAAPPPTYVAQTPANPAIGVALAARGLHHPLRRPQLPVTIP